MSDPKYVGRCRSCNAKILWTKTAAGKNMPVDHDSEIEYLWQDGQAVEFDAGMMTSHFSTCPDADKFRRR